MRRSVSGVAAAAVTVMVAALVPAAVAAAPATGAGTPDTSAVASVAYLPTGDAVHVSAAPGGRPHLSVEAAERSGVTGNFEQLTLGGDRYVFPAEARPFLGNVLDPSLFDVTALARSTQPSRIPVTLSYPATATVHVPGLTVTSRTGTVSRGYLSYSGAAAFRAALVRSWKSVASPGGTAPKSLFGGVTHLAATGAAPASTVQPDYPQVTLVLKVLDRAGHPAPGGIIGLVNTDKTRKFISFLFYGDGEARASVPTGHYSAITDVPTFAGGAFTDRIIPIADFTVTENLQTVTFQAKKATVRPSVSTPRPASLLSGSVEFDRFDRSGMGSLGSSFSYDDTSPTYVAPTGPADVGSLDWLTGFTLTGGDGTRNPYSYDLSYVYSGSVPADEHEVVSDYQLATVDSSYYNDSPTDSQYVRSPIYPFQFGVFSFFLQLHTPVRRTEYVAGGNGALWISSLIAFPSEQNFFGGFVDDGFRPLAAGSRYTAEWLRGPLAPAPSEQASGDPYYYCIDCRTANKMFVVLTPYSDTTPGHSGEVSDPPGGKATQFALYRNGTQIAAGADLIGARVDVPAALSTYRLHLDVDRSADGTATSTSTSTDLVFKSSASNGATPPQDWGCALNGATPCTVLPLLRATVPLPTGLADRMPIGSNSFDLTIGRFRGAGDATITSATFQTSTDGTTFQDADVRRMSNGHYRVTITNPAASAGKPITIRVHATDDAGGSLTQTTRNAYLVASS